MPADDWQSVAPDLDPAGRPELVTRIREGFPVEVVDRLLASRRLSRSELDRTVLPRKTLDHRRRLGRLTTEQSDRLVRVTRVLTRAERTFGNEDKARSWLRRPTSALGGVAPLELLDTGEGARAVEELLDRIDHGLAA